jgi:hypothetical protein
MLNTQKKNAGDFVWQMEMCELTEYALFSSEMHDAGQVCSC